MRLQQLRVLLEQHHDERVQRLRAIVRRFDGHDEPQQALLGFQEDIWIGLRGQRSVYAGDEARDKQVP